MLRTELSLIVKYLWYKVKSENNLFKMIALFIVRPIFVVI